LAHGMSAGLAKREVEMALHHRLEDEEQRQDDNSE